MNKDVVIWASRDKEQFYDLVVDSILKHKIDSMNDAVDNGKDIIMVYETFVGISKKQYNGLDTVFKLEGLVDIFNKYFARNKIDLASRKDVHNGYSAICIYKFVRMKGGVGDGGGGIDGEGVVSKTDRSTVRDDVEIVESSKDKEKIAKKIEEERKLIKEG